MCHKCGEELSHSAYMRHQNPTVCAEKTSCGASGDADVPSYTTLNTVDFSLPLESQEMDCDNQHSSDPESSSSCSSSSSSSDSSSSEGEDVEIINDEDRDLLDDYNITVGIEHNTNHKIDSTPIKDEINLVV